MLSIYVEQFIKPGAFFFPFEKHATHREHAHHYCLSLASEWISNVLTNDQM